VHALLEKCPPISNVKEKERNGRIAISLIEKNRNGETTLSLAVQQEEADVVQLLVAHSADIKYIKELDETDLVPVMVETSTELSAVGNLLVERKSDWKGDELEILYWAARNGMDKLVRKILSKNGNQRGVALYWAAAGGKESAVK
jgi:hypothetical protein